LKTTQKEIQSKLFILMGIADYDNPVKPDEFNLIIREYIDDIR